MKPYPLAPPRSTPALRNASRTTPPTTQATLSVVIVDYRQGKQTTRLVRQLWRSIAARDGLAEILVIENAARAGSRLSRLRKMDVRLRRSRHNQGFARAVNHGCERAQGSWFLLLNPDVTVPDEFLDHLTEAIERWDNQADVGIVGLGLQNPDGSTQLSTGPFPTFTSTLSGLMYSRASRKYHQRPATTPGPVDWVTGCCLLVRRSCWEQLGGLDPAFFLYYEDVDLCRRAWQSGWKVVHDPSLSVTHHHPLHSRGVPAHLRLITRHALLTYAQKHWSPLQFQLLSALVRSEAQTRSWGAWLRGYQREADIFATLATLTGDLADGNTTRARVRLRQIVEQHEEQLRDPTRPVGGHPQPAAR